MKKWIRIFVFVVAAILCLSAFLYIKYDNNLKAAWFLFTTDIDKKQELIEKNEKVYSDALESLSDEGITITEEKKQQLNSGNLTEEEAIKIILGEDKPAGNGGSDTNKDINKDKPTRDDTPSPKPHTDKQPETSGSETNSGKESQTDGDSAKAIAKMYVLKSKFTSKLSGIEIEIKKKYNALPKEQQNPSSRKSIAGSYIKEVSALEKECDTEVEQALSELKAALEAKNKSIDIVDTLRKAYNDEKSLKKAYYLDVYKNGI